MSAVDQIIMAEEKVAEFQSQLATVESVLEKAEQVAVTGEKAGRCLRRSFRVLLAISIVAAIALIVKKVMAGRSPEMAPEIIDSGSTVDAELEEAVPDDGGSIEDDPGSSDNS